MSATTNPATRIPGQVLHNSVVTAIGAIRAVTVAGYEAGPTDPGLLCVLDVVADSLQRAADRFEVDDAKGIGQAST